jgi:hypothetical protein
MAWFALLPSFTFRIFFAGVKWTPTPLPRERERVLSEDGDNMNAIPLERRRDTNEVPSRPRSS